MSGLVHCWAQGRTCGRTLRVVHGSGSNHKRNEVKHKWTVSNFRCLGKRARSIQLQWRRRFQSRAGRTCPRGTTRRFNSSTSEGGADGAKPEQSPETDGLWLGDSSMLNTGEFPNAERESLLSWILEDNVPQKYYLSARACQGILTRASRRGKPLPEVLRQALMDVIGGRFLHPENP